MRTLCFCVMLFVRALSSAQVALFPESPVRETRAVWLTTFKSLDWPKNKATDAWSRERQKAELCDILDKLQAVGINTVLMQTRLRGTVVYKSRYEPWDECLTGIKGCAPGYDPLEFAIEECHRRGMQLHAWVVCLHPQAWMDPASPETARYLSKICCEIVQGYDVDGVSLDYIRYPERGAKITRLPIGNNGFVASNDRYSKCANITSIVRTIYNNVKDLKPWVRVTSSPVGKYSDLARYRSGGWNARDAVCQDVQAWMSEGIQDGIFPMMYFKGDNFYPFALDWKENSYGCDVCPGLGIYFLSSSEKNWPLEDITRELEFMRRCGMGQCFFRARFLLDNVKGLYDWLRLYHNRQLALPVEMRANARPVGANVCERPEPVNALSATYYSMDCARLSWLSPGGNPCNVYSITSTDTVLVRAASTEMCYDFSPCELLSNNSFIGVRTMDKYGIESEIRTFELKSCGKKDNISIKSINFAADLNNNHFNSKNFRR